MRIIAGRYRGRRLKAPTWDGLRPTSDKLRETLFNIVGSSVVGGRVVDGCAGTGAVGIEALSRGAEHVTFVESDPRAIRLIRQNLAICGIEDGYTIRHGDLVSALTSESTDAFTMILLDPPYDTAAERLRGMLQAAAEHLADRGTIVLERATRCPPETPAPLETTREVRAGDSTLTFFARAPRRSGEPGYPSS